MDQKQFKKHFLMLEMLFIYLFIYLFAYLFIYLFTDIVLSRYSEK